MHRLTRSLARERQATFNYNFYIGLHNRNLQKLMVLLVSGSLPAACKKGRIKRLGCSNQIARSKGLNTSLPRTRTVTVLRGTPMNLGLLAHRALGIHVCK